MVRSLYPGELDIMAFFLDDGVMTGSDRAVAEAVRLLKGHFADVGLEFNEGKCEVIAACEQHDIARASFPRFDWLEHGNFKLLGAPEIHYWYADPSPQLSRSGFHSQSRGGPWPT